jgi:hypothetical protein
VVQDKKKTFSLSHAANAINLKPVNGRGRDSTYPGSCSEQNVKLYNTLDQEQTKEESIILIVLTEMKYTLSSQTVSVRSSCAEYNWCNRSAPMAGFP